MSEKIQFPPSQDSEHCPFCQSPKRIVTITCGWCGTVRTYTLATEEELGVIFLAPRGAEALDDRVAT